MQGGNVREPLLPHKKGSRSLSLHPPFDCSHACGKRKIMGDEKDRPREAFE